MPLQILYFAWVRERIGLDGEKVTLPDDVTDIASLIGWLAGRGAGHAEALADRSRIRAAVDNEFATSETSIVGAREVALFPPVTGG